MSELINSVWVEKYRPKDIVDCVLTSNLESVFNGIIKGGFIPNLLLHGSQGIGKTTVAKALCNVLEYDYLFVNASDERGIDIVRDKILGFANTLSLSGKRKCIILDEADLMTLQSQTALRSVIEETSINCSYILTCNYLDKIIKPIHSRCSLCDFKISKNDKKVILKKFLTRIFYILDSEKVSYDKKVVCDVIGKFYPDFRRVINQLQQYAISNNNVIDEVILSHIKGIDIQNLIGFLKERKFHSIREWTANSIDSEPQRIFRKIYDSMFDFLKPSSIADCIVLIGQYQYKSQIVIDQEINLMAFLTELMITCEFKD